MKKQIDGQQKQKKSKWKTIIIVVVVLFILGSIMSDGDETNDTDTSNDNNVVETNPSNEDSTDNNETTKVTLAEKELFNKDGIVIKATGLTTDGFYNTEIKLYIENNSEQDITVQTRNSSINGYMIDFQLSSDVAVGKKANDTISIDKDELAECNIKSIADIEFSFHIFDTDSWDTIVDTEMLTLATSASGNYTQEYDDSGDVLYDQDGIRIISKGLIVDDFDEPELYLYIENNSEQNITIQARDTSVNGFMVDPTISSEVVAGKKIIDDMSFSSSDLEANSITSIETIDTSFHIFTTEGWDTITDTEVITITIK